MRVYVGESNLAFERASEWVDVPICVFVKWSGKTR